MWRKLLCSRQPFHYPFLSTDTAIKVQAAKDKARQANDTANDVLAQIKDLNQNLLGLRNNYSKLADDVAKTNAVVKDPIENSKIFFGLFGGVFFQFVVFTSHLKMKQRQNFTHMALLQYAGIKGISITSIFCTLYIKRILNLKGCC